ncbi:glycosyltransferase [Actinoplanes sp. NPDC051633]|uniref:glycosyltransferase n=1 Tax=Actinoplanes sp. NPDC051633 TaxID=3155670 RepID=UPI00343BB654
MPADRTLVIWRSAMLPASETFVRNHGAALTRWRPAYLGATRIASPLSEPADVVAFPDGAGFLRLRLTGRSPILTRALGRLRPGVVHAHFGGDGWLVSRAAAACGAPLVITVHGHDVTRQPATPGPLGLRYRRNLRAAFRRAAVVLAVSEPIRERAIALGADPAKVRVHHTGIPIPAAVPGGPKRWDVAFVGRLVEKKGVGDLIAALARTPAKAVVIGSGPLEAELRRQAGRLDVTFLGNLPPGDVTRHLAASKMLAAPSRTAADGDTEGLPTTILEAAALGLPVVATRHSGIPEAVKDGETGLLGPEGDPRVLAGNIGRLLADPGLRSKLGSRGREFTARNFDLARQTSRLEDLYDELADAAVTAGAAGRRRAVR